MKLIARAWGDGTDFINTELFRPNNIRADRRGLGDMICEVSNLYAQTKEADILIPYIHDALNNFINLLDINERTYTWNVNRKLWNQLVSNSSDNTSLAKVSGRQILHCYPEFDYVKLDQNKFVETEIPKDLYGTIQEIPFAKKCGYDRKHIQEKFQEAQKQYKFPFVSIHGLENLGLAKVAYIIKHAQVHVGIDSGMTHFANTIKNKKDVHIYVPSDRITGVTYRWLKQDYDVRLL